MEVKKEVRSVLFQNIFIPMAFALLSCLFLGLLFYKGRVANNWLVHTDEVIKSLTLLQKEISDAQAGARGYLLTRKDNFLTPYISAKTAAPQNSEAMMSLVQNDAVQNRRARELKSLILDWFQYTEGVLSTAKNSPEAALKLVRQGEGESRVVDIRNRLQEMVDDEYKIRILRSQELTEFYIWAGALFIPFLLIGNAVISYRGRKSIFNISDRYDEIIHESRRRLDLLEREKWLKDLEVTVSSQLVKSTMLKTLCEDFLGILTERFQPLAAAISTLQNSSRSEYVVQTSLGIEGQEQVVLRIGENTLYSTVVATRKTQVYEGFQSHKWQLKSATGLHQPQFLMIAPVFFSSRCVAIIELVFNQAPDEKLVEFFNDSSQRLGAIFANEMSKDDLVKLNEQLLIKTEELKLQQEEIQTTNEELEHRAQMLRESQLKLEENNAELEEANEILQKQSHDLNIQKQRLDEKNQELLNARSALELQAKELHKTNQYKSQFLANMSHELRTPLNSALILAQLMCENREKNLTPKQVDNLNQILKSGQDLLLLINDILDLSKIESGNLDLEITKFSASGLVDWMRGTFSPLANDKNLKLDLPKLNEDFELQTDSLRLRQVVANLVSNAIKFTKQGQVSVQMQTVLGLNAEKLLQIEVKDTGIGIAPEHLQHVFEPFKQADETITRSFGGTGLGLAISRQLTNLLGGEIQVTSKLGVGSNFTLHVPLHLRPKRFDTRELKPSIRVPSEMIEVKLPSSVITQKKPDAMLPALQGVIEDDRGTVGNEPLVLIIEDDLGFARIMLDHVRDRGYKAIVATHAEEGLNFAVTKKPKAILLDINLPDFNGLIVLEQLKSNPVTRSIPIHVVSVSEETGRAIKLGAAGYHRKPMSLESVRSLVEIIHSDDKKRSKRVLVVDDDPRQTDILKEMFSEKNIEIRAVDTGEGALQQLQQDPDFDCVVLDLKLPDMTGFDVLNALANQEQIKSCPPVIINTAATLSKKEELELKNFANSLVIKGTNSFDRLLDEISIFIHHAVQSPIANLKTRSTSTNQLLSGQRILLVDDDMRNIFALTAALEQSGAEVSMAQNGLEAVQILEKDAQFNLILMDVMMPVMDGFEAIQKIRHDLGMSELPIIALTAKAMKNDREACIRAGANDYLAKPIDLQRLFSLIRIWTTKIL